MGEWPRLSEAIHDPLFIHMAVSTVPTPVLEILRLEYRQTKGLVL